MRHVRPATLVHERVLQVALGFPPRAAVYNGAFVQLFNALPWPLVRRRGLAPDRDMRRVITGGICIL